MRAGSSPSSTRSLKGRYVPAYSPRGRWCAFRYAVASFSNFVRRLRNGSFASAGGSVEGGVAMYNYLRALPVKIVMHNNGSIDSIANVIFHAADERKAAPHTTFLFHGVAMTLGTNPTLNRSQIQELLSQISALEGKIANILIGRCGLTLPEIQNLFLNGETKHTAFALDKGIIQEVGQPLIPKDAKFYSLNFT